MGLEKSTKVGIIGLGRSGWGIHAATLAGHPGFRIDTVADPVPDRRTEAEDRFGSRSYHEPADLIADPDVDLVVVASPSSSHVPMAVAALEAGKHVVVEKPMAQDAAGVDRMAAAAKTADRVLTCYQPRRLDPDLIAIQDAVAKGLLGELILLRRSLHNFSRRADWQMLRKFDGGALSNTMPHLLDQALLFADPQAEFDLLADLRHTVGAGDAEDHVKLALRPTDGGGPLLELEVSSAVALPQPQWFVVGTAGAIIGSGAELTLRRSDPEHWAPLTVDAGPAPDRKYGTGEVLEWTEQPLELPQPSRTQAEGFYDRLARTLTEGAELFVTPASVRRQIELLSRAREQTGYR